MLFRIDFSSEIPVDGILFVDEPDRDVLPALSALYPDFQDGQSTVALSGSVHIDTSVPLTAANASTAGYLDAIVGLEVLLGDRVLLGDIASNSTNIGESSRVIGATSDGGFCFGWEFFDCEFVPSNQQIPTINHVAVINDRDIRFRNEDTGDDFTSRADSFSWLIGDDDVSGLATGVYSSQSGLIEMTSIRASIFTEVGETAVDISRLPEDIEFFEGYLDTDNNFRITFLFEGEEFSFNLGSYEFEITPVDEVTRVTSGLPYQSVQEVALLYEAGLNRDGNVDLPGLNFWIDAREGGVSEKQVAQAFLDSGEFEAAFGAPATLSDPELVEQLYRNVLNREGEQGGIDFWVSVVGQPNFGRDDLLLAFAESPENLTGSAFVETLEEIAPGEWAFA
ncbi:MAG: DUF4214 domain-containing protein [Pseudomonadota bacterium]